MLNNIIDVKTIYTALLLVFLTSSGFASGKEGRKESAEAAGNATTTCTIKGSVNDKFSGEMLTGVEVTLVGSDLKVYTDFDGTYEFNNLTPGTYKISFEYVSYKTVVQEEIGVGGKDNLIKTELKQL